MSKVVTKQQLISEKLQYMENHMTQETGCVNGPENLLKEYKQKISYFKSQFKTKWAAARNAKALFIANNQEWLNNSISLPAVTVVRPGRPTKSFQDLRDKTPLNELTFATQNESTCIRQHRCFKNFERYFQCTTC
jgi:hypothetical protein